MKCAQIGLLHPGEMGAAVGAALVVAGHHVGWASEGRSEDTVRRATVAGLEGCGSLETLCEASEVVLAICPPHMALSSSPAGRVASRGPTSPPMRWRRERRGACRR